MFNKNYEDFIAPLKARQRKVVIRDTNLLKRCDVETARAFSLPGEEFESYPCSKSRFIEKAEDEISLDSIFSYLLARIQPSEETFRHYRFDVSAKELLNEKQALLFHEQLYISQMLDNMCFYKEHAKVFLEKDLREVGKFDLRVEESYDGYVVFSKSKMDKDDKGKICGHWLRGKYDDHLNLICERRKEHDFVDNAKIVKTIDMRIVDDQMLANREVSINEETERFKAVINVKGRDNVFLMDGGILLLIRYLIVNNYVGVFHYYSMNLMGKIIRCEMSIKSGRKEIKLFHRTFKDVIQVINTQYFNDIVVDISESFYSPNGKMILHYWHNYNYILHETKGAIQSPENVLPKLELKWRSHPQFMQLFEQKRELHYAEAVKCFQAHPELSDLIHDYLFNIIQFKPTNVLDFTVRYFQKFKSPEEETSAKPIPEGENPLDLGNSCRLAPKHLMNKKTSCKVCKHWLEMERNYLKKSKMYLQLSSKNSQIAPATNNTAS